MQDTMDAISHIRINADGEPEFRPLVEHLGGVAQKAASFAGEFGAQDWARYSGMLHDLGKYSTDFQRYIRAQNDLDAHIETAPSRVNHSTAGAVYAAENMGTTGAIPAYLIAGHHAGLPDFHSADSGRSALNNRLREGRKAGLLDQALAGRVPREVLEVTAPTSTPQGGQDGFHLWVRMLFSCLVDGDFLDTESFMNPEKSKARGTFPPLSQLRDALNRHMEYLARNADPTPLNAIRAEIYRQCLDAADGDPGLFSLTVPTGGGKTLASLVFALRHAESHGKRRVIYAIPYTSIIEQTADVFREVLGDLQDALIEHHSNAESDPEREDHKTRLACENWDAPLIVTTNVQLFESLFAARTSRCRKLHNIANSVIILDEAQTLPPEFLQPMVNCMRLLAEHYGVSFVFCTATQPELGSRKGFDSLFKGLDGIREIMDDVGGLYRTLKRVNVHLPPDLHAPTDWETLAGELAALDRSVLCIVNRREDCRVLYELLHRSDGAPVYHLSALMCGQHRSDLIAEIKQRLKAGDTVKVISTQLVEAGVDLDFPVVYRALAGLDAIAQAAGRCNREDRLPGGGEVHVFIPPKEPPPGLLRQAAQKTRQVLHGVEDDPLTPERFRRFFTEFYGDAETDKRGIEDLLAVQPGFAVSFRTAAAKFRLIDDDYSDTLFVKHGKGAELLDLLAAKGPERWLLRKLQRYAVNLPKWDITRLQAESQIAEPYPGMFVQTVDTLYHTKMGVLPDRITTFDPVNIII